MNSAQKFIEDYYGIKLTEDNLFDECDMTWDSILSMAEQLIESQQARINELESTQQ